MKLKGITKLVLAGTALAATAATLTTSTYAWYVTNTTVTATGVQGSVAGTAVDGSLFIAKNKAFEAQGTVGDDDYVAAHEGPDKYVTDITLTADPVTGYSETELNPQSKAKLVDGFYYYKTKDPTKGSKEYYKVSSDTFVAATAEDTNVKELYEKEAAPTDGSAIWVDKDGQKITTPNLLTFKFWLKASAAGTASVKFMVDNITETPTYQMALSEGSGILPTGVAQGDTFAVDAIHALRMDVTQKNGTATATTTTYAVDEIAKNGAGTGTYTTAGSKAVTTNSLDLKTGGDANKYYYNILEEAPYNTNSTNGTSTDNSTRTAAAWESITLLANTDTLITFNVWLEGSDADCWDSCRGQDFKFDFEFGFTADTGSGD